MNDKQMLFPAGIQLTPYKKVYIPKISPIYLYKTQKTAPKEAVISIIFPAWSEFTTKLEPISRAEAQPRPTRA